MAAQAYIIVYQVLGLIFLLCADRQFVDVYNKNGLL